MKKMYILIVTASTFVIASSGYTASTEEERSIMGGMHGKGMMHQGMTGHHMMHSGVSPVTIMIQPGMMPMTSHGVTHQGAKGGHKGDGMGRGKMMKEHMERVEQRLESIEALLSELVELQKKGE